jgi:hypothetical protein
MAGEIAQALRLGVPVYRIDVLSLLSRVGRERMGPAPGVGVRLQAAASPVITYVEVHAGSDYYTVDVGRALTGHAWS